MGGGGGRAGPYCTIGRGGGALSAAPCPECRARPRGGKAAGRRGAVPDGSGDREGEGR